MKRAEIREYVFKLLYCTEFHEKTDRMAKADLNILRLAYYEMNIDDDIPKPVAVDQAVELAKKYGTDDSPSFVNGVLAKLF